jgi:CRISPR/Cas system-associated protein endoribonuclease Cas2
MRSTSSNLFLADQLSDILPSHGSIRLLDIYRLEL